MTIAPRTITIRVITLHFVFTHFSASSEAGSETEIAAEGVDVCSAMPMN
jgi:hypothetical protein